jgi:hypothetical protein
MRKRLQDISRAVAVRLRRRKGPAQPQVSYDRTVGRKLLEMFWSYMVAGTGGRAGKKRGGLSLIPITERAMPHFLAGRPREARLTYRTHVNAGKSYPYASKRQSNRIERQRIQAGIWLLDRAISLAPQWGAGATARSERQGLLRQLEALS